MVALSAALLGSAVGGLFGYRGAIDSQERQAQELRIADERERRREAYLAYLDDANRYRNVTSDLLSKMSSSGTTDPSAISEAFATWLSARSSYQGSVNSLYVYGSDAAWSTHRAIAATLPYAVGYIDAGRLTKELSTFAHDQVTFASAFDKFLGVMCHELAARPRTGCSE